MKAIKTEASNHIETIKGKIIIVKDYYYVIYKNGKEPNYNREDVAAVVKDNGKWCFCDNEQHDMYYTSSQLMAISKFMKKLEAKRKNT